MLEWLSQVFAAVCGQNPEHTWAPGGWFLPCCQRCTGLYVGAGVATLLHGWLKPELTGRFLGVHGLFLLLMVPFGYHWLPQEELLRTGSGVLFGFGLVTFLWLQMPDRNRKRETALPQAESIYGANVVLALVVVPAAAAWGGRAAALLLSCLAFFGAATLLVLALANVGLGVLALGRRIVRLAARVGA